MQQIKIIENELYTLKLLDNIYSLKQKYHDDPYIPNILDTQLDILYSKQKYGYIRLYLFMSRNELDNLDLSKLSIKSIPINQDQEYGIKNIYYIENEDENLLEYYQSYHIRVYCRYMDGYINDMIEWR
jgi:hypothetical protein